MLANETGTRIESLLEDIRRFKDRGYRLVTTTCLQDGEGLDIIYHFDRNYHLEHLRLPVRHDEVVPSISAIFPGAYLAENEIQDQYGIRFSDLPVDYHGRLFLAGEAPVAPMLNIVEKAKEDG